MGAPAAQTVAIGVLIGAATIMTGGTAGVALMAAAAGMAAMSSMHMAEAQSDQAKYQEAVAEQNAIRAQNAADEAIIRGEIDEQQHRLRMNQTIGKARANAAARGVLVDQGSVLDITSDLQQVGEIDAMQIRRNATIEQIAALDQSAQFQGEGDLHGYRAQHAREAGQINAATSLVSGGSQVADKWYSSRNTTG